MSKPTAVFDIECYRNYFLVMFRRVDTGATKSYELYDGHPLNTAELKVVLENYRLISFNGNGYDIPMVTMALTGASNATLKRASDSIIRDELRPWDFENKYDLRINRKLDHIDLIEVAFGDGSLKLYGGRLHSQKLQDLPIEPGATISPEQREELRMYCANDLQVTLDLFNYLKPQIELREHMSAEYGQDLRSKSDAQIAEAVLRTKCGELLGEKVVRPKIPAGTRFKYEPPHWLAYRAPELQTLARDVLQSEFVVSEKGGVEMPPALIDRAVTIGKSIYRLGIGGLHSSETSQALVSNSEYVLIDRDVTSYYPSIILTCRLAPKHLERDDVFLNVYRRIVEQRVAAKHRGDKVVADVLKIVANGSFGKLGSVWSTLYSPHLMIQVTVTGQLALLMLIERLEADGISVVSGNTDGIVMHCRRDMEHVLLAAIEWWGKTTGFTTEETRYAGLFSRDVNNYLALKEGGGSKGKGVFTATSISKNPDEQICCDAVVHFLLNGTPIEDTVRSCTDIRRFLTVRAVKGGGVQILQSNIDPSLTPAKRRDVLLASGWVADSKGSVLKQMFTHPRCSGAPLNVYQAYRKHCGDDVLRYLGKVVRFYIGTGVTGALHYNAMSAKGERNKVPDSDGAVPVMDLPSEFPADLDHAHYIDNAYKLLNQIGYCERVANELLFA